MLDKKEYKKARKLKKLHRKYGIKKGSLIMNARRMESTPTPYEQAFREFLKKHKKRYGKYKQQFPVYTKKPVWRGYIFDFYLPNYGVLVEVDGMQHNPERDHDKNSFATKKGYLVLHLPNQVAAFNYDRLVLELDDFINSGEKLRYAPAEGSV